jgi:hypothetical protein
LAIRPKRRSIIPSITAWIKNMGVNMLASAARIHSSASPAENRRVAVLLHCRLERLLEEPVVATVAEFWSHCS